MSSTGRFVIAGILLLAILCLLAGCGGKQGAAPRRVVERDETAGKVRVRLKSELAPARGTLGDPISWRLTATLATGALPGVLLLTKPPESLELDASKPPGQTPTRGGLVWSREYVVRGFDLGAIELPQAAFAVIAAGKADTLEFPRDTLFVDSLSASVTGTIRPDRGPMDPPLRPIDYIVVAAAALLLVAAAAFLIRMMSRARRRRELKAVPAAPEPPEVALDRALAALEREVTTLPRDVFYERLALALRAYAAAVSGVPAPDLTTTELDRELARHPRVRADDREGLIATLRRADLAKFGRFEDEESEARSILREARAISGSLVGAPVLAPASSQAAPVAGAP